MTKLPEKNIMSALRFSRSLGKLELLRLPVPAVEGQQVRIQVNYAGICGSDIHIIDGTSPCDGDRIILGHEITGIVDLVGEEVADLSVGDRVVVCPQESCGCCIQCDLGRPNFCVQGGYASTVGYYRNGGYAEFCIVNRKQVRKIPQKLPFEVAVFAEPMSCVVSGWRKLNHVERSATILVQGAGICGLLWLSYLHFLGFRNLSVSDYHIHRCQIASQLSFSVQVFHPDQLSDRQYDVIIESAGTAAAVQQAYQLLKIGGRLLIFGGPPQGSQMTIDPSAILFKELKIFGTVLGQDSFGETVNLLSPMYEAGYFNQFQLGTKIFPLEDYAIAFQELRQGKIAKGSF
jgi:D-arabinitol dehydrogenase (NADP+)